MRIAALWTVFALVTLAGCQTPPAPCGERADNQEFVDSSGTCLAITTQGSVQRGAGASLVVLVDGRARGGRPTTVIEQVARDAVTEGVVSVVVAPPGLRLASGRRSDTVAVRPETGGRIVVADSVALAIQTLREHYGAGRVVLVGEEGGAATGGLILGRHPGLVTDAVMVNCPCGQDGDPVADRSGNAGPLPIDLANRVPPGTRVVLVAGSDESGASVEAMRSYAASLEPRGVEVRLITLESGTGDAVLASEITAAVQRLLR